MASITAIHSTTDKAWDNLAKHMERINTVRVQPPSDGLLIKMNSLSPFHKASAILDTGCGGGVMTARLLEIYGTNLPQPPPRHFACDFSNGMVDQVKAKAEKEVAAGKTIWSHVETGVRDAQDLHGLDTGSFSHAMAGFVFFMVPDPQKALTETRRVLEHGGVLGLTSWKSTQWAELMSSLKRSETSTDGPKMVLPAAWSTTEGVEQELKTAGFRDVHAVEIETSMPYESHEELCHFFLTCLPHMKAITKDWTPEEVDAAEKRMVRQMKQTNPQAPGLLRGTAVAAVGRK